MFEIFDEKLDDLNLIQLVNFDTWSRIVGLESRSSVLDHVYVNCVGLVRNVSHLKPIFGDHELVTAELCISRPVTKISTGRDWRYYSKEALNERLEVVDWTNDAHDVQELWNDFEVKIIRVIDEIAPISEFHDGKILTAIDPIIKHFFFFLMLLPLFQVDL